MTLKAVAEAATAKRITELSYIPGEWDKVPEQRTAETATNLLQQIQEQEKIKADIIQKAQKRMDHEVQVAFADTKVTETLKKLERQLRRLLKRAGVT